MHTELFMYSYLVLHLSAGTFTRACVDPHEAVTALMVVSLLQRKRKVRFNEERQENLWEELINEVYKNHNQ